MLLLEGAGTHLCSGTFLYGVLLGISTVSRTVQNAEQARGPTSQIRSQTARPDHVEIVLAVRQRIKRTATSNDHGQGTMVLSRKKSKTFNLDRKALKTQNIIHIK